MNSPCVGNFFSNLGPLKIILVIKLNVLSENLLVSERKDFPVDVRDLMVTWRVTGWIFGTGLSSSGLLGIEKNVFLEKWLPIVTLV